MSKVPTITPITGNLQNQVNQINTNLNNLANAHSNTISRDGSTPNDMEANIDLNNNNLLNVGNTYTNKLFINGVLVDSVAAIPTTGVETALVTPYDYGATIGLEETVDNHSFVQAMMDDCTSSWDGTNNAFTKLPSFAGKLWRCDSEVFCNELRQPGFTIFGFGGGINSRNTNGVAFNCLHTNQIKIHDFHIYGNEGSFTPDVGILYGRNQTGGIAPGVRLFGFFTRGNFNKAAGINLASEVGGHIHCYFQNSSPNTTATAFCWANSIGVVDNNLTEGSASLQASLDVAGNSTAYTGNGSNIGHDLHGNEYKRASPKVLTISSITKANPAVVTMSTGTLATSGWTNGTKLSLHDIQGMTELATGIYTIANIDTVNDTFELSGVDSTAFGTFTSGRCWQATGPAVIIGSSIMFNMQTCYLLSYSEVSHIIDLSVSQDLRDFRMEFQGEATHDYLCEFKLPASGTKIIQGGFHWKNVNNSRKIGESVFKITGNANLRIDGGSIILANLPAPYPTSLFNDASNVSLNDVSIDVPTEQILNANTAYLAYDDVKETAHDRFPRVNYYTRAIYYDNPTFRVKGGNLVTATFESTDTAASSLDDVPPYVDIFRNKESPSGTVSLGNIRFTGNNDATEVTMTVTSISKSNPATVTVDSGELTAAGWTAGHFVLFGGLVGMPELSSGAFEITNVNAGAGTFDLLGIDSTLYDDFVSSNVTNRLVTNYASVSAQSEDVTAYAEYGRLLFKAAVDGVQVTTGYANQYGLFSLNNPVQTTQGDTQTNLRLQSASINTFGKYLGKMVWDTTNSAPVWAAGTSVGSVWVDATGSTVHTPV